MIRRELIIDGTVVPLDNQFGLDYTKTIADISKPNERQSDYSKTVTIVGTKDVNKLFNHWFDVNVDSTFNPQKKVDAIYYEDSIEQLRGFFRLISVSIEDDVIIYQGSIHGELSNIFKDMGDSLISDLDWTDLDHTYDEATIRANWAGVVAGTGYYYPMIDYTGKTTYAALNTWGVTDFRPAIFFREIWDRIFTQYGFTYTGTNVQNILNNLLMPSRSETLTLSAQEKTNRSFDVGLTVDSVTPQGNTGAGTRAEFDDDSTGAFYNTISNDFNVTTFEFVCGVAGNYNLSMSIDTQAEYQGAATTLNASNKFLDYDLTIYRVRGGSQTTLFRSDISDSFAGIIGSPLNPGDRTTGVNTTTVANPITYELEQGDKLWMTIEYIPTGSSTVSNNPLDWNGVILNTSNWSMTYEDDILTAGSPLSMALTIPSMKQKDFVMGVVKAFNLYIEQGDNKDLLVEPRDDYYTDDVIDWTNKKNGKLTLFPNRELQGREYIFKFKGDKDFFHTKYADDIGLEYGDLTVDIDNDFKTDVKVIELPFGSTLNSAPSGGPTVGTDRPIPSLYVSDDNGTNGREASTTPRMLRFAGDLTTADTWTFAAGTKSETTFPYAGDFEVPYGILGNTLYPVTVLDWQRPQQVYYDGDYPAPGTNTVAYGGNTLYAYYENMLAEIQNPVATCSMYLNTLDVYNLSFRPKYFIDTAYYRLLKISKQGDLYNCEFLKIG